MSASYETISVKSKWKETLKVTAIGVILATVVLTPILVGTTKKPTLTIPPVRPPVNEAAPVGLKEPSARRALMGTRGLQEPDLSFDAQIRDRFFSGQGPTAIYEMLKRIDVRTNEVNVASSQSDRACITSEPVEVSIEGWPGEELTMWTQCYTQLSETLFMMFGRKGDTVYIYERDHMVTILAYIKLDPKGESSAEFPCCYQVNGGGDTCECDSDVCKLDGVTAEGGNCRTRPETWPDITFDPLLVSNATSTLAGSTLADVNIYFSVGNGYTASQTGSRGLFHLEATPKSGRFQASAAGIGLGFCGVQFASDGSNIFFHGSQDGVGGVCENITSACVSGDLEDTLTGDECDGITFSIAPLGRQATTDFLGELSIDEWDASLYPGGATNLVDIDDVSTSSVKFGPTTPPTALVPDHNFDTDA